MERPGLELVGWAVAGPVEPGRDKLEKFPVLEGLRLELQPLVELLDPVQGEGRQPLLHVHEGLLSDPAVVRHELLKGRIGEEDRDPRLGVSRDLGNLDRLQPLSQELGEPVVGVPQLLDRGGPAAQLPRHQIVRRQVPVKSHVHPHKMGRSPRKARDCGGASRPLMEGRWCVRSQCEGMYRTMEGKTCEKIFRLEGDP